MSAEERRKILQMVQDGKISAEQAASLMRALDADADPTEAEVEVTETEAAAGGERFDAPEFEGGLSDVFLVGDDQAAKGDFLQLAQNTPFRYLDAGPLESARTVERLTMITGRLGRQLGTYPRMNWRLLGQTQTELAAA